MKTRRFHVLSSAAITAAAILSLAGRALAFEAEGHSCYATAPDWNAAKGALVSGSSPGPVSAVLKAVGESRTHLMISNGNWATESTTRRPTLQTAGVYAGPCPACIRIGTIPLAGQPLRPMELAAGSPGFSQINMGGAYAYWQDATQVWRQVVIKGVEEVRTPGICGNYCKAMGSADWLWFSAPYTSVRSEANSNQFFYSLGGKDSSGNFQHLSYGLNQYMSGLYRIFYNIESESPLVRGLMCSQVPVYAYNHFVKESKPYIRSGSEWVFPHDYTHDETVNAGTALWNSVYNDCQGQGTDFWSVVGNSILSLGVGGDIKQTTCNNVAWQVLNCFYKGEDLAGGGCKDVGNAAWTQYRNSPSMRGASSTSPDESMGLIAGRDKQGPWSQFVQGPLQWNGGGSTYGCFY